jgi:hypothetical protein
MFKSFKQKLFQKRTFVMVLALLLAFAMPVIAAVQLNLFTETTPTVTDCIQITAGSDGGNDFVTVDAATTVAPSTNGDMSFIQSSVALDSLLGGRNNYTDLL